MGNFETDTLESLEIYGLFLAHVTKRREKPLHRNEGVVKDLVKDLSALLRLLFSSRRLHVQPPILAHMLYRSLK